MQFIQLAVVSPITQYRVKEKEDDDVKDTVRELRGAITAIIEKTKAA